MAEQIDELEASCVLFCSNGGLTHVIVGNRDADKCWNSFRCILFPNPPHRSDFWTSNIDPNIEDSVEIADVTSLSDIDNDIDVN